MKCTCRKFPRNTKFPTTLGPNIKGNTTVRRPTGKEIISVLRFAKGSDICSAHVQTGTRNTRVSARFIKGTPVTAWRPLYSRLNFCNSEWTTEGGAYFGNYGTPGASKRPVKEPSIFLGETDLFREWGFSVDLVDYASSFLAGNASL